MDMSGDFGWHLIAEAELKRVQEWMGQIEGRTWDEACSGRAGCKSVSLDSNEPPAQKMMARLQEMQKDDVDNIYEFHLDGLTRFWGLRRGYVCHLVWWDPNHQLWPSKLKNT
jgi:hypothetical protein